MPELRLTKSTCKDLKAQVVCLIEQADVIRAAEFQTIVDEIRANVVECAISEMDIFGGK